LAYNSFLARAISCCHKKLVHQKITIKTKTTLKGFINQLLIPYKVN